MKVYPIMEHDPITTAHGTPVLQSYAAQPKIEGVELIDLVRHVDDGGSMTELGRLGSERDSLGDWYTVFDWPSIDGGRFRPAQINYSEIEPGAIKAFHLHKQQTDVWFVPPGDRMLVVLFDHALGDHRQRCRLVLGAGRSQLLHIPPGVAHGVKNIGSTPGRIIYFTDLHFDADPARCDEYRLPWDYLGAQIWEINKG